MKRFLPLALAALAVPALTAAPVHAQVFQPELQIAPGSTLLTLSGEGRVNREPDMALFSAGVTTQGTSAAEALAANSAAMPQVIAALRRAGIAERDIQTSNLSVSPIYVDPNQQALYEAQAGGRPYVPPAVPGVPKIVGYSVNNTVTVRQRKLGNYGAVIDALASAGANQINGPSFQMDKPEPALDEARVAAVKQARERATLFANAAGLKVGRIVSISESSSWSGPQPMFAYAARDGGAPPPAPPVATGELQLTANVTMMFELTP
jgi:uncharacterized protein YggE